MFLLKKILAELGVSLEDSGDDSSELFLQRAGKLIEEYGLALQIEGSDILPDSLLPGKTEEIKTAIKLHLALLPPENEGQRQNLKSAYAFLATFVPQAEALAFSKGDESVKERCDAAQSRLTDEIDEFCRLLPSHQEETGSDIQ